MLRLIALILPALIPSWRFFKSVGPSPRVEFRVIDAGRPGPWQEDCPRPERLGWRVMIRRLFWNPDWNRKLYLVSLSERLVAEETQHCVQEINSLLMQSLEAPPQRADLQFRLVFVLRQGGEMVHAVVHESQPMSIPDKR